MKDEYLFCPRCAEPLAAAREGELVRMRCPTCGFVRYRNPAPAAGVLIVEGGEVLLVKRRFDPFKDTWSIPSGFVEYDEDVRITAVREAREETGFAIELDGLFDVESCFDDPRGNALLVLFRARRTGGAMAAGDDAAEVRFHPLDGLPEIAFEAHRRALAKLAREARG